jgi:PDDEXK-like domain of unknown function (DUF3799)
MKITQAKRLPITTGGVYSGVDLDDYHSPRVLPEGALGLSSSNLRTAWDGLAYFHDSWAHNPDAQPKKVTRPMILGKGAHHILLGEDRFSTKFIGQPEKYPSKDGIMKPWHNGADYCIAWHESRAKEGRTVLTSNELSRILGMMRSLKLEPLTTELLSGAVECSMIVKDKETGIYLKWRPDSISTDGGYSDLKCCESVTDVAVYTMIKNSRLHMQAGLGWEVCEQLGLPFDSFHLVLVESDRPHCSRIVPMHDEDIARGRQQCRLMINKIARAIEKGHFPGPGEGDLRTFGLPANEREAIDARMAALAAGGE